MAEEGRGVVIHGQSIKVMHALQAMVHVTQKRSTLLGFRFKDQVLAAACPCIMRGQGCNKEGYAIAVVGTAAPFI